MTEPTEPIEPTMQVAPVPVSPEPAVEATVFDGSISGPNVQAVADDNVIGFDTAIRLDRDRTERSILYAEAVDRLNHFGRGCVDRMEALLFSKRLRVGDCQCGDLYLPDGIFNCSEGQIWYHFSPKRRRFVLSFFHIEGHGGGMPLPEPIEPCGGTGLKGDADYAVGIAARISAALRLKLPEGDFDIDLVAMLEPFHSDRGMALGGSELMTDIAKTHCVMVMHNHRSPLPPWSLLSRCTTVHQQLESPFARAIFAGEVTCRLGWEIGRAGNRRALRWGPVNGWTESSIDSGPSPMVLLEESRNILDAVRDNVATDDLRWRTRHFLTASLMDGDLMADDRRLALVRSELIYRLAISLAGQARGMSHPARGTRAAATGLQSPLMRKYALVSEFVRMSGSFFSGRSQPGAADVVREMAACSQREPPLLRELACDLLAFGDSTLFLVNRFSSPTDGDWELADGMDMVAMHERLTSIASEIFGFGLEKMMAD